jgi:energy-coupling factor transport system substrate-specific component
MNITPKNYFKFSFKFFLGLVLCLLVRLIPFRVPNVEPILATTMPFSKAYGAFAGFSFAVLSILLFDLITHTLGIQTFFTVLAYGALGWWSASYFRKREASASNFVRFAIIGTLFFDALTGLTIGPLLFHQSFLGSLALQIPFTVLHLIGNTTFAILLSPAIYKFLIKKKKEKIVPLINTLNPKTI